LLSKKRACGIFCFVLECRQREAGGFVTGYQERIIQVLEEEAKKCAQILSDARADIARCEPELAEIKKRLCEEREKLVKESRKDSDQKPPEPPNEEAQNDDSRFKRLPMDMLRAEYRGVPLVKIAQAILSSKAPESLDNNELTRLAYETRTEDEFKQARNSFASFLRTGSGKYGWEKKGRGLYKWTGFHNNKSGEF
jgi:DNA gyrase/topoisomerase IV subunit A